MKNIKYQSRATNPLKAIHRTLGFAFYCERRKDEIPLKKVSKKLKVPTEYIEDLELGRGKIRPWLIKELLEYYNRKISVYLDIPEDKMKKN